MCLKKFVRCLQTGCKSAPPSYQYCGKVRARVEFVIGIGSIKRSFLVWRVYWFVS